MTTPSSNITPEATKGTIHAGAEGVVIDADNLNDWFDVAGNFEDPKFGEGFNSVGVAGAHRPKLPILDVVVEPPFLRRAGV